MVKRSFFAAGFFLLLAAIFIIFVVVATGGSFASFYKVYVPVVAILFGLIFLFSMNVERQYAKHQAHVQNKPKNLITIRERLSKESYDDLLQRLMNIADGLPAEKISYLARDKDT